MYVLLHVKFEVEIVDHKQIVQFNEIDTARCMICIYRHTSIVVASSL